MNGSLRLWSIITKNHSSKGKILLRKSEIWIEYSECLLRESRAVVNRANGRPLINLLSPNYLNLHNSERIKVRISDPRETLI